MKILLLGRNGQLGWELQRTLAPLGPIAAFDHENLDFANSASLTAKVRELGPQIIINSAAYTDVDKAEGDTERVFAINATAPGVLAEAAKALGAGLIHYSTDYVFDGRKGEPYGETDAPNPLNVYGASKLAGERAIQAVGGAHLILRTAWVYSLRGNSFVNKVLQWARRHVTLRVVEDQISNPTWARMLAEATSALLARATDDPVGWLSERAGVYHLAGSGHTSRFEWAKAILELDPRPDEQVVTEVLPAATAEFTSPAQRPLVSALSDEKMRNTFDLGLPDWRDALVLAMRS